MLSSEEFREEALKYGMSTEDVQIGEDGLHDGHRARLAWHFWCASRRHPEMETPIPRGPYPRQEL